MTSPTTLGAVLRPAADEVLVKPDDEYTLIGVYSFGRGLFRRQPIRGAATSYRKLVRARAGQFVMSRLNGWEGAVAIVPEEFDGLFLSPEYPTFDVDAERLHPRLLAWLCRWPRFWENLTPRGSMVRRKRSHPDRLASITVVLPPISEQVAIAETLDNRIPQIESALGAATRADELVGAGWAAMLREEISAAIERHGRVALEDAVEINPESIDPRTHFGLGSFVYIDIGSIDRVENRIARAETLAGVDAPSRARRAVRTGDVLVSTVRPYLRAFACVPSHLDGAVASTGFAALRPRPTVRSEFLLLQLLSDIFVDQLTTRGGHYPAVNDMAIRKATVVNPPRAEQDDIVRTLSSAQRDFAMLRRLHAQRRSLLERTRMAAIYEALRDVA